jgi:hypothetical protein
MGADLEPCSCWMAPTSTTHWLKTVGASGIGSMRQGMRCLRVWRSKLEMRREGYGLIHILCRHGNLEKQERIRR